MRGKVKWFTLFFIYMFLCGCLYSQSFYLNFETKYRIPAVNTELGPRITNAGMPYESIANVRGSFGKGVGFNAEFGYMFNQWFGVGLNIEYIAGIKTLAEEISSGSSLDESIAGARRLYLTPTFTVEGGGIKLKPFAKLGVVLPAAGHVNGTRISNDPALLDPLIITLFPEAMSFEAKSKVNGMFSVGFQGTLGMKYHVNDQFGVFVTAGFSVNNFPRERFIVTEAVLIQNDGTTIDVLPFLVLGGQWQYTEYTDVINLQDQENQMVAGAAAFTANPSFDLSDPANLSEQIIASFPSLQTYYGTEEFPHQELEIDSNFNSLNFGLGFNFNFGNKGKSEK